MHTASLSVVLLTIAVMQIHWPCQSKHFLERKKKENQAYLTYRLHPGSNKHRRSEQLLRSPLGGASWVGQIGWTLGQGPGRGGQRGGQRLGWGTLVGDQRRRSKSKGCQKEQEKGGEEEEVWRKVYSEWAWALLTVHPGKGGESKGKEKQGKGWGTTGGGGGEVREASKGDRAKKKQQQKEQRTDEMSR